MRAIVVAPLLILAAITDTAAQNLLAQPGQRVRVTAPSRDLRKHQDTFDQLRGDTVVLASVQVPLSAVKKLERYKGRGFKATNVLMWGTVGLVSGAAVGFGIGYAVYSDDCFYDMGAELCGLIGAMIGGGSFLLIGSGIGALMKSDEWEKVPLDRLRVSVVPAHRGFGVGASIAF